MSLYEGLARTRIRINPTSAVQVFTQPDFDAPGAPLLSSFRCLACDEPLTFDEGPGEISIRWWKCPSCGIELTADEAQQLLNAVRDSLERLNRDVSTRSGRWHWVQRLLQFIRR